MSKDCATTTKRVRYMEWEYRKEKKGEMEEIVKQ